MNYKYIFEHDEKSYTTHKIIFWLGLLAIMLLRNFYFGWAYFPYLDDYNQYGIFFNRAQNLDSIWENIVVYYDLIAHRPVVDLLDAYIFQRFWPNMQWLLLFFTMVHFAVVYLFYYILKNSGIGFGLIGIFILALFPGLFEAVYWISASSRIVLGMFFVLLSVFFALKKNIWAFAIINIISTGFYEQIIVFNLVFTLAILLLNSTADRKYYIVPVLSTFLIGIHYIFFLNDGRRGNNLISFFGLFGHWIRLTGSIFNTLIMVNFRTIRFGLMTGFSLINLSFFLVIAYVLFLYFHKKEHVYEDFGWLLKALFGVILIITPFAPFFIMDSTWLPPRTAFVSFFGIAIVADVLFNLAPILKKLVPLLIIPMFLVHVAELNNFQAISNDDQTVIQNFLALNIPNENYIIILNAPIISSSVTYPGNHRLENITSSNWAFQGGVNAATNMNNQFRNIHPVPQWRLIPQLDNPLFFGMDDQLNIFPLNYDNGQFFTVDTIEVFGENYDNMFRKR